MEAVHYCRLSAWTCCWSTAMPQTWQWQQGSSFHSAHRASAKCERHRSIDRPVRVHDRTTLTFGVWSTPLSRLNSIRRCSPLSSTLFTCLSELGSNHGHGGSVKVNQPPPPVHHWKKRETFMVGSAARRCRWWHEMLPVGQARRVIIFLGFYLYASDPTATVLGTICSIYLYSYFCTCTRRWSSR